MNSPSSKRQYVALATTKSVKMLIFVQLIISLFCFSFSYAAPFDELTDRHKQLIEELVALTGEMPLFREAVREHYHAHVFIPTEKMFVGSILENDLQARNIMNSAIDSVLNQEFDEGISIKYVHYQSFSTSFTENELLELIKFYRTDIGKRTMDSMTELFMDWKENRERWAVSLRSKVRNEVKLRLNKYHDQRLAKESAMGEKK